LKRHLLPNTLYAISSVRSKGNKKFATNYEFPKKEKISQYKPKTGGSAPVLSILAFI
jgi:hypothetical protein